MGTRKIEFQAHGRQDALLRRCKGLPDVAAAVVNPCDAIALNAEAEAARLCSPGWTK